MKSKIMKILVAALALASFGLMGCESDEITVMDADGNSYPTVKIGNQVWMAKNLNVNVPGSVCYDNDPVNCEKNGRLYTWDAAMDACPDGWSLPDNSDFSELKSFVESKVGEGNAGSVLKGRTFDMSVEGALEYDDRFGFSGQAAGDRFNKAFQFQGETAYLWSSSEGDDSRAFDWVLSTKSNDFFRGNIKFALKKNGFSVRCIKKSANNSKTEEEIRDDRADDSNEGSEVSSQRSKAQPSSGTLKDSRDGKTYKTVKIGPQIWMAKNLNVNVPGSMCYENKPENCEKYGRLYTWEAARNACPSGWHLPSKEEMKNFVEAVKVRVEQIVTQKKLDAVTLREGEGKWYNHLRDASWSEGFDSFGFSALPAGINYNSNRKKFDRLGRYTYFWTSTERNSNVAYCLRILGDRAYVDSYGKGLGSSVRCLQDSN